MKRHDTAITVYLVYSTFFGLPSCWAICIKTRFNSYLFYRSKWAKQPGTMEIVGLNLRGFQKKNGQSVSKQPKLAWGSCISVQCCGAWKHLLSFLSKKAKMKKTSDLCTSHRQKCEQKVCFQIEKKHREDSCLDIRSVLHI